MGRFSGVAIAVLLLAWASPLWAAFSLVQHTFHNVSTSTSTVAATFGSTTVTGNFIVAEVGGNNVTVSSIADTAGDTFVHVTSVVNATSNSNVDIWAAFNITSHASNVVTATLSGTTSYETIYIQEWSGGPNVLVDSVSLPLTNTGNGTTATTNAFTTTSGDLVIGYGVMSAAGVTVGAGYTAIDNDTFSMPEYQTAGSSSVTATLTGTSGNWDMVAATFYPNGTRKSISVVGTPQSTYPGANPISVTITTPAGCGAGNVLVSCVAWYSNSGGYTLSQPSGSWQVVANQVIGAGDTSDTMTMSYLMLTGSAAGSYTWTTGASNTSWLSGGLICLSNPGNMPLEAGAVQSNTPASTTATFGALNIAVSSDYEIGCGNVNSASTTSVPTGFTAISNPNYGGATFPSVAGNFYKALSTTAPASYTSTLGNSQTSATGSFAVIPGISAAGGGGGTPVGFFLPIKDQYPLTP